MQRKFIRHGFILFLVALLFGLFIPQMKIPRLGLSAHTIGLLSGVLLIAIGSIWNHFDLSDKQKRVMYWCWLYSSYINWLGVLVGALFGAGKVTPVAASGAEGAPGAELMMALMLGSVAVASFIAVGMSLWGIRPRGAVPEEQGV
ncbi:hydrogenase [bacterium]|nr:hydrogenase [bacterium]